jgi:hypothetical protein
MLLPLDSASSSWGSAARGSTLPDSVRSAVAPRRVLLPLADPLRAAVLVQDHEPPADAEGEALRSAPRGTPASCHSVSGRTHTATRTAPMKVCPSGWAVGERCADPSCAPPRGARRHRRRAAPDPLAGREPEAVAAVRRELVRPDRGGSTRRRRVRLGFFRSDEPLALRRRATRQGGGSRASRLARRGRRSCRWEGSVDFVRRALDKYVQGVHYLNVRKLTT